MKGPMKTNLVTMTIADYCSAFERTEVQIDRTYQRSPDVWPLPARSYLIETILKGFPIPKLALHQVTDLKSRKTTKYVVDGQQRSSAILAFFKNEFRLSRNIELAGAANRTYLQLSDEHQGIFLAYLLYFDQFEAAADEDVREYFRRVNSFTAPLNPEEERHARYQGAMKWFVYWLAERHGETFVSLGVIPKKSVVRMADAKLIAEIIHALTNEVTTTSKRILDSMYRALDRDEEVPEELALRTALDDAVDQVVRWPELRETPLLRTHTFYSLILALILVQKGWPTLQYLDAEVSGAGVSRNARQNLLRLAAAIEEPDVFDGYSEFMSAAAEKTNVKAQRETRIRWLAHALTRETI